MQLNLQALTHVIARLAWEPTVLHAVNPLLQSRPPYPVPVVWCGPIKHEAELRTFRVVGLDAELATEGEHTVQASTPEAAATLALGLDVVRGSSKTARPVAKVYWQDAPEQVNMVRLYARIGTKSIAASGERAI